VYLLNFHFYLDINDSLIILRLPINIFIVRNKVKNIDDISH